MSLSIQNGSNYGPVFRNRVVKNNIPQAYSPTQTQEELPAGLNVLGKARGVDKKEDTDEMKAFKKLFLKDLSKFSKDENIVNLSVHISDEAWEKMKDNPEYRKKMLDKVKSDMAGETDHPSSVDIRIGVDEKDYKVKHWSAEDDTEFWKGLADSAYEDCGSKETVDDDDSHDYDKDYKGTLDEYLRSLAKNSPDASDVMKAKAGMGPVRSPMSLAAPRRFSSRA